MTRRGGPLESRLPLIVKLTAQALGIVEGPRVRRPLDPVAAWLLRQHPELAPAELTPPANATVRARTTAVDGLLVESLVEARRHGKRASIFSFGAGFDARWYRLSSALREHDAHYTEIEEPQILAFKETWLEASPWQAPWDRVVRWGRPMASWSLPDPDGTTPICLMEGLAGRMDLGALRAMLSRLRGGSADAVVILGLPAMGPEPGAFSARKIRALGWRVDADLRLSARGRLVGPQGNEFCPGMHGLRVVRLVTGPADDPAARPTGEQRALPK